MVRTTGTIGRIFASAAAALLLAGQAVAQEAAAQEQDAPEAEAAEEEAEVEAPVLGPPPAFEGQTAAPPPETPSAYEVQTIVTGLASPFGFALLPDGDFLVSERPGLMRIVSRRGVVSAPLEGLPDIKVMSAGGLHDVTLDPDFDSNRLVYFTYFAPPAGEAPARWPRGITQEWMNLPLAQRQADPIGFERLARGRLSADRRRLDHVEILLEGLDRRVVFAPDGMLYALGAERYRLFESDVDGSDHPFPLDVRMAFSGRVARIHSNGAIPLDNPLLDQPDLAAAETFSFGHRDPQGAAFHPETGALWVVEHGPMGGDEINIVRPGRDYGWPNVSYGLQYDGSIVGTGEGAGEGYEQPLYFWRPSIGPSGAHFYRGELFPQWRGDLFVAALAGRHLVRLELDGERVTAEEPLLTDLDQRIRDLEEGPDGSLYVLTDAGSILRLIPPEDAAQD